VKTQPVNNSLVGQGEEMKVILAGLFDPGGVVGLGIKVA